MRPTIIFLLLMGILSQTIAAQEKNQPRKGAEGKVIAPELPAPPTFRLCRGYPPPKGERVFEWVEEMPTFSDEGCDTITNYEQKRQCSDNKLRAELASSIYLPTQEEELFYTLYFSVVITKEGKMSNIQILKVVPNIETVKAPVLASLKEFASKHLWNPGRQRGKPVNVRMVFPIKYRIH